jgi:hypothetical protein
MMGGSEGDTACTAARTVMARRRFELPWAASLLSLEPPDLDSEALACARILRAAC